MAQIRTNGLEQELAASKAGRPLTGEEREQVEAARLEERREQAKRLERESEEVRSGNED